MGIAKIQGLNISATRMSGFQRILKQSVLVKNLNLNVSFVKKN